MVAVIRGMGAGCVGAVVLWLGAVVGLAQADEQPEEKLPPARQNQILRDFYRKLYPHHGDGQPAVNDMFLEGFVDRQIDAFIEDVDRRLTSLTDHLSLIERLRLRADSGSAAPTEADRAVQASLRRLAGECDGLADRLHIVFPALQRKIRPRPRKADEPEQEMDDFARLGGHIRAADQMIRQYLFSADPVVQVSELEGEDMLTRLDHAEQLARRMAEGQP